MAFSGDLLDQSPRYSPGVDGLAEAVLTSTHYLCFGAKIRKIGIPLHTPVLLCKSGAQLGIYYMDMIL